MKEVVNISLAGVSFTIEKDAYTLLESYLNELKEHYKADEIEVVNDIEERISELLIERGCKDALIQTSHVEDVINILGRPSEIDDSASQDKAKGNKVKKIIYRDTQSAIIAGVCSGLGAYFNLDAVWVRVILIVACVILTTPALFISGFLGIHISWFGLLLLLYCVLWLIIPEAKTVSQRCAMRGESTDVDTIHKKFAQGARDTGNEMLKMGAKTTGTIFSTIWRVIKFTVGVFLILIGVAGLITFGAVVIGIESTVNLSIWEIPDFIALSVNNTLWLKIFGTLTCLLPFIGMLYGGIQLTFNFKSPKFRPGLMVFLIWLVSALIFVLSTVAAFKPFYKDYDYKESIAVNAGKDTLFVECPKPVQMQKPKMKFDAGRSNLNLFYLDKGKGRDTKFAVYPHLRIIRQADTISPKLVATMTYFTENSIYDHDLGEMVNVSDVVTVKDSLITINPAIYSKKEKFNGKMQKLRLYIPESTVVILKEPFEHNFNGSSKGCDYDDFDILD